MDRTWIVKGMIGTAAEWKDGLEEWKEMDVERTRIDGVEGD